MAQKNSAPQVSRPLNIFLLAMINVAAICSLKNWPLNAMYGFSSLFFYLIAAIGFFIPSALVSAELASGWPKNGGIYAWIKEAMGHKMGFLAIWLQWISNVVWYPTTLSFVAIVICHSFNPSLTNNSLYTFVAILIFYWGATFLNFRGMKLSGWVSTSGVIIGTMIPGLFIIALGMLWFFSDRPIEITMSWKTFIPDLSNINGISYLAGTILGFSGIEMSAVHARDVINPRRNYPKAILLSTVIILGLSVLGTLAVAIVIPHSHINLLSGGIDALGYFFKAYHLEWMMPLLSLLIGFGSFSAVVTWIIGPSRGLLTAAQDGDLPPLLHKINKHHMPITMLVVQGCIVTVLSSIFLFVPDISSSFWILIALASVLYNLMYILMFVAAIMLRYKQPNTPRPYAIPGGKLGMWIVAGLGLTVATATFFIGFLPPANISFSSIIYVTILVLGVAIFATMPFLILIFKRSSWNIDKDKVNEDEPTEGVSL